MQSFGIYPMIYIDKESQVLLDVSGDGGDSAHLSGLFVISTHYHIGMHKFLHHGQGIRHPKQFPWTNPNNFSRDQLMPLVAGLYVENKHLEIKKLFFTHMKRLFFCQNIDRDIPGSSKKPYPHKVNNKWRIFDYRDPLMPHHIYALASAAKINLWPLYPLAIITLVIEILSFRFTKNADQGALIATCYIMKELKLFKKLNPKWNEKLKAYFLGWRRQSSLYDSMKGLLEIS